MRNEMPSQKWRKLGKQGGVHYENRKALLLLDENYAL
jgi:hypothetical protein